jgi:hypothetical protein
LPEALARDAIAHEEVAPGGKVRMTFRVDPIASKSARV